MTKVVFDQSVFVKTAIANLGSEGGIGLVLTALMILIFLGNFRATFAVMLSIPFSALAAFLAINASGGSINTMVLGGLALAFSRLIDNSVVVLENIFRHLEMGETPEVAAEKEAGSSDAGPCCDFHHGDRVLSRSSFFMALADFCSPHWLPRWFSPVRFLRRGNDGRSAVLRPLYQVTAQRNGPPSGVNCSERFVRGFNRRYDRMLMRYDVAVRRSLLRPHGDGNRNPWCLSV